jgi:hypothetical protein
LTAPGIPDEPDPTPATAAIASDPDLWQSFLRICSTMVN